jgi:tryptophan synthase alpha chain
VSRIAERFAWLAAQGRKAFVPYLTAGDPSLELTEQLCWMLAEEGADVVELGVPFTDPIADGPTNQRAAQRALNRGVTPGDVIALAQRLKAADFPLPLVLFTYANPLEQLPDRAAAFAAVDGILVTDLPPEEAGPHIAECRAAGVDPIFLAAPTTPTARLTTLGLSGSGFLYYVSSKGVTGARSELPADLEGQVAKVKDHVPLPVCVGFGISTAAIAERVCSVADGFVVGSALGAVIERTAAEGGDVVAAARQFVRAVDPRPSVG